MSDTRLTAAQVAGLRAGVLSALSASGAATVGVAVDVDGAGPVLRSGSARMMAPASTQKVFTGLSALLALGPDKSLRTRVVSAAPPSRGRIAGPVWLVAGGDPFFSSADLRALARGVRAAGVTTVTGGVRLDDYRFDGRRNAPGWAGSYVPGQAGPLSAMALDRNRWRSDRAYLADPAMPVAVRLQAELRRAGVTVAGPVRRAARPAGATTLAFHDSVPVQALVRGTLKASDNFAAELLLKEVGRRIRADGSSRGGAAAVRKVLRPLGVPAGSAVDGSGLSRLDRQSATGQVALLQAARRTSAAEALRTSLPRGCRDGTLRKRFCGSAADGRVWAKTGTLYGVRTLAGYTFTADGREVVFSILLSGVRDPARALAAIDRAVTVLTASPH